ncbi:hypothetical protein BGZ83_010923 [Gryganskiella cystojenkinii]|nr:hypothetical protein BGZ83_010923 [Gryganskiella cystojenkinii]
MNIKRGSVTPYQKDEQGASHQSTIFLLNTNKHVIATRIALESLNGAKINGTQVIAGYGTKVIDNTWHARVVTKLQSCGFPTNDSGHTCDYMKVLEKYRSGDSMMNGGVSTDMIAVCVAVAADTWAHGGPITAWCGAALSCSVAALAGGISKVLAEGNESDVRNLMMAALPTEETALINDIDNSLAIDGHTFCGCDIDGNCGNHYMQGCVNARRDTSMPREDFVKKAAGSSVVTGIDMTRVVTSSVLKTRPADAHIEGGKWYEYVKNSRLPPSLWQRHLGAPVVLNNAVNRWLAGDCLLTGSRLMAGGYFYDCGAMTDMQGGEESTYASTAARDEKAWRESIGAAEVCVSVQVTNTWNSLVNEMAIHARGADLPFVILEGLTAKQRSTMLVLDTSLQHAVLTEDAGVMSFADLALVQVVNGYSDQAEDVMSHVYNNGLFLAFGAVGAVFDDDHPAAYGSLCRSLMASCQYRGWTPGAQAICYTILWNLLNGRHRTLEKGVYVKWELIEDKFDLAGKLEKWKPIEKSLCAKLCGEGWIKGVMLTAEQRPANGTAGGNELWARAMRNIAEQNGCGVDALLAYICADCDCTPETVCRLHGDEHSGSDAMGEMAKLIEKTAYNGTIQLFGWLLCGVVWFRRALHLRCGFMGYGVILAGAEVDFTCA